MDEKWIAVKGYGGDYLVSNTGIVISRKRTKRTLKIFLNVEGQKVVTLFWHSKPKTYPLHRLVYDSFIGFPADPNLCYVYFKDGDKSNCNLDNLECVVMETTDGYDGGRRGRKLPEATKKAMKDAKREYDEETVRKAAEKRTETCRRKREAKAQGVEFTDYDPNYGKHREYFSNYHKEYYRTHREELQKHYREHIEEYRAKNKERYYSDVERYRAEARERYRKKHPKNEETPVNENNIRRNELDEVRKILLERINNLK